MAEVTAMRNNATDYPIYGLPYTVTFPFLDADGDLVSAATTPDAEVSLNGDTFTDCTNESTEIATTSGMWYLSLTAAELTADIVSVIAKSATSGMKTTPIVLYPRKLPLLLTSDNAGAYDSTTTINLGASASSIDDFYNGCVVYIYAGTGSAQVRRITDYVGSTKLATVHVAWATNPDATSDLKIYRTDLAPYAIGLALESTLTSMKGATFDTSTDSLEAIRNRGDAAWTSGSATAISYAPTSIAFTIGNDESPAGETFANLAAHDDVYVQCGENATTGLTFDVLATLVGKQAENPSLCRISAFYNGSATHELAIQVYNYISSAWESAATMKTRTTFFDYVVPLDSDHHDPANGSMKIRFLHNVITYNASHYLRVDYVSFEKRTAADAIASDVATILSVVNDIDLEVDAIVGQIGTPVALDGGTASVSGMLTKLADDNGGADYNAGTDSMHEKPSSGASLVDIEGSTVLAKEATVLSSANSAIAASKPLGWEWIDTPLQSGSTFMRWIDFAYSPSLDRIISVAYSGDYQYLVPSTSVMISDDGGLTWTIHDIGIQHYGVGLIWVEEYSRFIMSADSTGDTYPRVLISDDGEAWSIVSAIPGLGDGGYFGQDSCYSPDLDVLLMPSAVGKPMISIDGGVNWSYTTGIDGYQGFCWSKDLGIFVGVTTTRTTGPTKTKISTDGISWTDEATINDFVTFHAPVYVAKYRAFYIVSILASTSNTIASIAKSTDGKSWVKITHDQITLRPELPISEAGNFAISSSEDGIIVVTIYGLARLVSYDGDNFYLDTPRQEAQIPAKSGTDQIKFIKEYDRFIGICGTWGMDYIYTFDAAGEIQAAAAGVKKVVLMDAYDATSISEDIGNPSADDTTIYAQINAAMAINGTEEVRISIVDGLSAPVADAQITVMNSTDDLAMSIGTTNALGQFTLALDPATYKLRMRKAGYTFTVPETMVVATTGTLQSFSYTCAAHVIATPTSATLQTLYGDVRKLNWAVATGDTVTAVVASQGQYTGGSLVQQNKLTTTVAVNSTFQLQVLKGSTIKLTVENHGTHEIKINQEDSYDVSDYLAGIEPA